MNFLRNIKIKNFMRKKQETPRRKVLHQQNNLNINNSNITVNNNVNNVAVFNNYHQLPNRIDRETSPFLPNSGRNYPILNAINKNAQRHPNGRRWSPYVIGFFILLYFVSASAYRLLQSNLPIPSESTIHLHAQKFFADNSYSVLDLKDLPSLLHSYRNHIKESNFSSIEGIIAVDAVSLYSIHKFENNSISGFINFENLTIEDSEEIKYSFANFENFLSNHSNQTIKSAFVFQFHPINTNYPVFLIHLFPWISGKANEKIEQRMFTLGNIMRKNFFNIIGYSFDGDSTYRHNLDNIDKHFNYSIGSKYQLNNQPLFFFRLFTYFEKSSLSAIEKNRFLFQRK